MRSIRRSLLGYLLVLLAIALSAVGALVDRFAHAAIRSREKSEVANIEHAYKVRRTEAKKEFDDGLVAEAKGLAVEVYRHTKTLLNQRPGGSKTSEPPAVLRASEDEARQYRLRSALLELAPGPNIFAALAPAVAVEPILKPTDRQYRLRSALLELAPGPSLLATFTTTVAAETLLRSADAWKFPYPYPNWVEFDGPKAIARIQEALGKEFAEDPRASQFQFTLVASYPNRGGPNTIATARFEKVRVDLPVDPAFLERTDETEPKLDDLELLGLGLCRRVVTGTREGGRPLWFWFPLPAPPAPAAQQGFSRYPPNWTRGPDVVLRIIVHTARPYSELDARLTTDQKERDDQITRVRSETQMELSNLRARLIVIGAVTFAALVLGGWFFVARGLAPLHTLSDAVSRVSEKDFRLPVGAEGLGRELAPIHARITQTLTLLQRAFAREKQAVADISHELRTPIASLLATIDVALRKPRTPEQYRTTLEECRLITKQLGELVERIMTLALLDAGNDQTQLARTDASELARGCAAVIRPLAAANTVTLLSRVEEDLVLDTDAGKLREVLINLLHNAVEYNRPDGTIEMTARRDGAAVAFEVRDTGIGMTADVRERIFERFYRADASRHATGIHAGLGLAIVKEYVARMNGTITVESEPDVGTTFRVTLPAPLDPDPADRPQARGAAPVRL